MVREPRQQAAQYLLTARPVEDAKVLAGASREVRRVQGAGERAGRRHGDLHRPGDTGSLQDSCQPRLLGALPLNRYNAATVSYDVGLPPMHCPFCGANDTRVTDSRLVVEGIR